jgi:hypothetical protein
VSNTFHKTWEQSKPNMDIYATGNVILIRHQFKPCCLILLSAIFKSQLPPDPSLGLGYFGTAPVEISPVLLESVLSCDRCVPALRSG